MRRVILLCMCLAQSAIAVVLVLGIVLQITGYVFPPAPIGLVTLIAAVLGIMFLAGAFATAIETENE